MAIKFVILFALVAVSLGSPDAPTYGRQPAYQHQQQPDAPAQYNFDWSVDDDESGNNYGQKESRDGDDTEGSYYVLLPDGRTQKVTYNVNGDSGFVADVTYEGEARYEEPQAYKPRPQPQAYLPKPQQPSYN